MIRKTMTLVWAFFFFIDMFSMDSTRDIVKTSRHSALKQGPVFRQPKETIQEKDLELARYFNFMETAPENTQNAFFKELGVESKSHYRLAKDIIKHPYSNGLANSGIIFEMPSDSLGMTVYLNDYFKTGEKEVTVTKTDYNRITGIPVEIRNNYRTSEGNCIVKVKPGYGDMAWRVFWSAGAGAIGGAVVGGVYGGGVRYYDNFHKAAQQTIEKRNEVYGTTYNAYMSKGERIVRFISYHEHNKASIIEVSKRQEELSKIYMNALMADDPVSLSNELHDFRQQPYADGVLSFSPSKLDKEVIENTIVAANEKKYIIVPAVMAAAAVAASGVPAIPIEIPELDDIKRPVGFGALAGFLCGGAYGAYRANDPILNKRINTIKYKKEWK